MKLIVLSGRSSCGKTNSLTKLVSMLLETDGIEEIGRIPKGNPQNHDFEYMLEYNSSGKTKILISTWGDYPWILKDCCETHNDYDAIICACNMDFMRSRKCRPFEDAVHYDKFATVIFKQPEDKDENKRDEANNACAAYLLQLMKCRNIIK